MTIEHHSDIQALQEMIREQRDNGRTIGFVPTMGFLHQGHQSLIEASHTAGCFTVVSIFVNPAQFGPNEDLDSYPRDPKGDFEKCVQAGADLVWYPDVADLYPPDSETMVTPGEMQQKLCGVSRPAFFGGICTVVLKFFNIIKPDKSWFGEKDFQQLSIIRRMVKDFYLDVEVLGGETVREPDGLAMSSRNARLKPEQRNLALTLYRVIQAARDGFSSGERDADSLQRQLTESWPQGLELDYLEFRDPNHLNIVSTLSTNTRIFLGAWLDGVRLIDNASIS